MNTPNHIRSTGLYFWKTLDSCSFLWLSKSRQIPKEGQLDSHRFTYGPISWAGRSHGSSSIYLGGYMLTMILQYFYSSFIRFWDSLHRILERRLVGFLLQLLSGQGSLAFPWPGREWIGLASCPDSWFSLLIVQPCMSNWWPIGHTYRGRSMNVWNSNLHKICCALSFLHFSDNVIV